MRRARSTSILAIALVLTAAVALRLQTGSLAPSSLEPVADPVAWALVDDGSGGPLEGAGPRLGVTAASMLQQRSDKHAFELALRTARYLRGMVGLRDRHSHIYDLKVTQLRLDVRIEEVLEHLRESRRTGSTAAAEQHEAQLRELIEQQAACSIAVRGLYLRQLNERVEKIRADLERDSANFRDTVARRFERLLEQVEPESSEPTG